jgi:hypothetical protein
MPPVRTARKLGAVLLGAVLLGVGCTGAPSPAPPGQEQTGGPDTSGPPGLPPAPAQPAPPAPGLLVRTGGPSPTARPCTEAPPVAPVTPPGAERVLWGEGFVEGVAADACGNVYVLVDHFAEATFAGERLPAGPGPRSQWLLKLAPDLRVQWVQRLDTSGFAPRGLAVRADGSALFLTGAFHEALTTPLGPLAVSGPVPTLSPGRGFLAALAPDGSWDWVRPLTAGDGLFLRGLVALGRGAAVAGAFRGASEALGLTFQGARANDRRGFTLLVGEDGQTQAVHAPAADRPTEGLALAAAPDGGLAVAYGTQVPDAPFGLESQALVVRLGPDGAARWEARLPAGAGTTPGAVAVGADGTVLLSAFAREGFAFAGAQLGPDARGGSAMLLGLRADGQPAWGRSIGRLFDHRLCVDGLGRATLAGTEGPADFGGGAPEDTAGILVSAGRVTLAGEPLDSHAYRYVEFSEGDSSPELLASACTADGRALLGGWTPHGLRVGQQRVPTGDFKGFLLELGR